MAKTSAPVVLVFLVVSLFLNGYNAAEIVEGGYEPRPPGKTDPPPPGDQPPPGKADPPPPGDQPPPGKADPPLPSKVDQPPPAPPVDPSPPVGPKPCFFGVCPIFNCGTFCFGIGYSTGQCELIIRCCCSR